MFQWSPIPLNITRLMPLEYLPALAKSTSLLHNVGTRGHGNRKVDMVFEMPDHFVDFVNDSLFDNCIASLALQVNIARLSLTSWQDISLYGNVKLLDVWKKVGNNVHK
jgi:hypothetical protein